VDDKERERLLAKNLLKLAQQLGKKKQ
jgi:hypothetical protein